MKKLLLLAGLVIGLSTVASAQITGTRHDFSTGATWNTTGEICRPCHTPHNSKAGAGSVMWNHVPSANATWTPYSNAGTLNSTPGNPTGQSLLCLSCHDGSVALDDFDQTTGGSNMIPALARVGNGGVLTDHHPISFTYDTALATADGELRDPATYVTSLGGTIAADLLFAGSLECASCHDVHGTGNTALLRIDNAASAFCLTCHNK